MCLRAAPAPAIEYGEILRKNSYWFACRARKEDGRYVPDAAGPTLMYFATEGQLLGYFQGLRRRHLRVYGDELAACRTRWLNDESKRDEDSF